MTIEKIKNTWSLFKQALAGDIDLNYTEGPIPRVTFLLAVPMILEMAMESVFAIVDIFFHGAAWYRCRGDRRPHRSDDNLAVCDSYWSQHGGNGNGGASHW